jgi:hypothetical protein
MLTRKASKKKTMPAMTIGLTDHVWSIRELLSFPYRDYIN